MAAYSDSLGLSLILILNKYLISGRNKVMKASKAGKGYHSTIDFLRWYNNRQAS